MTASRYLDWHQEPLTRRAGVGPAREPLLDDPLVHRPREVRWQPGVELPKHLGVDGAERTVRPGDVNVEALGGDVDHPAEAPPQRVNRGAGRRHRDDVDPIRRYGDRPAAKRRRGVLGAQRARCPAVRPRTVRAAGTVGSCGCAGSSATPATEPGADGRDRGRSTRRAARGRRSRWPRGRSEARLLRPEARGR